MSESQIATEDLVYIKIPNNQWLTEGFRQGQLLTCWRPAKGVNNGDLVIVCAEVGKGVVWLIRLFEELGNGNVKLSHVNGSSKPLYFAREQVTVHYIVQQYSGSRSSR